MRRGGKPAESETTTRSLFTTELGRTGNKRALTKPPNPIVQRDISSAAGEKVKRDLSLNRKVLSSNNSSNLFNNECKASGNGIVGRQPSQHQSETSRNVKSKRRKRK